MDNNKVYVRWHDGYLEEFEATEVRFGCDLLWMRLANGANRHIPPALCALVQYEQGKSRKR